MKNLLIITVGLPRSGKSTWAKKQGLPIVNPDSIRLAMHGQRFQPLAEPFVWATARIMVRALFLAGHELVILDATNSTRDRRDQWRPREDEEVLDYDWATVFKHIDTSEKTCIARAIVEGDNTIIPIIKRIAERFEPLEDYETVWSG